MALQYWVHKPPCATAGCTEHYGCRLRAKNVAPAAKIHARQRSTPQPVRPPQDPAWEKGIVTTKRPNGTEVPVLHANGTPWRQKEASEQRRLINDRLRETYAANAGGT